MRQTRADSEVTSPVVSQFRTFILWLPRRKAAVTGSFFCRNYWADLPFGQRGPL